MKNIAALRQYILQKITPPMSNDNGGYLSLRVCDHRRIPCRVFGFDNGRGWMEDMNNIPEPFTPDDIQDEMTNMIVEAFNDKFTYAAKRAKAFARIAKVTIGEGADNSCALVEFDAPPGLIVNDFVIFVNALQPDKRECYYVIATDKDTHPKTKRTFFSEDGTSGNPRSVIVQLITAKGVAQPDDFGAWYPAANVYEERV